MAEELFPTGDAIYDPESFGVVSPINTASLADALDANQVTYIRGSGNAVLRLALADSTIAADEIGTISVAFEARPAAGFSVGAVEVTLIDGIGAVWARSWWTPTSNPLDFSAGAVNMGSTVSHIKANELMIRIRAYSYNASQGRYVPGSPSEKWEVNNARMVVTATYEASETTALTPTGATADTTPTFTWSTTIDDPARQVEESVRVRVFNEAQFSAPGFNPVSFPATWDSGRRSAALHELVSDPLPTGTYHAYIGTYTRTYPGLPWTFASDLPLKNGGIEHFGVYDGPLAFSIVGAAPVILGPRVKLDALRYLTDPQRQLLTEVIEPRPRVTLFSADGTEIADLNLIGGSLIEDARQETRATATFECTDLDLVPPSRKEASGAARPLHPFGSYVHVCLGMKVSRTDEVMIGRAVLRIQSVKPNRKTGRIQVKASDFAADLKDARFGYPIVRQTWDGAASTPFLITDTVAAIVAEAGLAYRLAGTSSQRVAANYTNGRTDERPRALTSLLNAIGWAWRFDIDGVCEFGPEPDIFTEDVAYTFHDADANRQVNRLVSQIVDHDTELTRADVFDVVIASDDAGLYVGGAFDANPDSVIRRAAADPPALYIGAGSFAPGGRPFFYVSPTIGSVPAAESAAQSRIAAVALPAETQTARCTYVPDLRPDMMIGMSRGAGEQIEKWQVVKTTSPLTVGPTMTIEGVTIPEEVDAQS